MLDKELLEILACPETRQPVALAGEDVLRSMNERIRRGEVQNRGGQTVEAELEGGLVREDRTLLYPVRDGIPIMLVDEAIPL